MQTTICFQILYPLFCNIDSGKHRIQYKKNEYWIGKIFPKKGKTDGEI
jgi:hypothetical protein